MAGSRRTAEYVVAVAMNFPAACAMDAPMRWGLAPRRPMYSLALLRLPTFVAKFGIFLSFGLLVGLAAALADCRCQGCGCKGGPGWRDNVGRCVSHKELQLICGNPRSTFCTFEGATQ